MHNVDPWDMCRLIFLIDKVLDKLMVLIRFGLVCYAMVLGDSCDMPLATFVFMSGLKLSVCGWKISTGNAGPSPALGVDQS